MVIFLHNPPAEPMMGWKGTDPTTGMVTFVDKAGMPPHQLLAVFQSVLVIPNHEPAEPHVILLVEEGFVAHPPEPVTVSEAIKDPMGTVGVKI